MKHIDYLIKNAVIVNEGRKEIGHIWVAAGKIVDITSGDVSDVVAKETIDADNLLAMPGVIDDQVHFREPGLTHKGEIYTEARAAVAGGVTSYMEMPNTVPQSTTIEALEAKFALAAEKSLANYSFYIGATNSNADVLTKVDAKRVCGIKIFMGSSTGDMLVDNIKTLEQIFAEANMLIATHCEDEATVKNNIAVYRERFGEAVPIEYHGLIRSEEACYKSSSLAVKLAQKYNSRLHVLHLSTAKELELFDNSTHASDKRITAEVCVHHLWFDDSDYKRKGNFIKWNPAIKTALDREKLFEAVLNGKLDVIATDHAPHTLEEKQNTYFKAPSGGPLVQHSLVAMLEFYHQGKITIEKVVEKMCHTPAEIFRVKERGFLRKGYMADIVLLDLNAPWTVATDNILYKCGWSPFEGTEFKSKVTHTFVNGCLVYNNGSFNESVKGRRLEFDR